jgi:hypothetical protein
VAGVVSLMVVRALLPPVFKNRVISMDLNGQRLSIPVAYIPREDRASFRLDGRETELRLQAKRPHFEPFIDPEDDSPVESRYREEVSILASHLPDSGRSSFLPFALEWRLKDHQRVDDVFGLQRWVAVRNNNILVPGDVLIGFAGDQITSLIICTPASVPEPGTFTAAKPPPELDWIRNPSCEHMLILPNVQNTRFKMSYRRRYLSEWKAFEAQLQALMGRFMAAAQAASQPS